MDKKYKVKITALLYEELTRDVEAWKIAAYIYDQVRMELKSGKDFEIDDILAGLVEFWNMDAEVMNGGYSQCFFNGYAKNPVYIKAFLKFLGNKNILKNFEAAHGVYKANKANFEKERKGQWSDFQDIVENPDLAELKRLSSEYYVIGNNLYEEIRQKIVENKDVFFWVIK